MKRWFAILRNIINFPLIIFKKPGEQPTLKKSVAIALLTSSTFLVSYASLILLTSCLLAVNIPISQFNLIAALAMGLAFFLFTSVRILKLHTHEIVISFILLVFFVTLTYLFSGAVLDLSWDGQNYQFRGIQKLISGWNPIVQPLPDNKYYNLLHNHYAKGPWYASAAIGKFTPNIEVAKCVNFLMILATFGIVYATVSILLNLGVGWAIFISILASANPVSLTQSLSFYVDGQVASILTIVLCLIIMLYYADTLFIRLTFISCIILAFNIKFTSAVYAVIFLLLFLVFLLVCRKSLCISYRFVYFIAFSMFLGLASSFHPYISNLIQHGNPFFPILGPSPIDVMKGNTPSDFVGAAPIVNLLKSIFSPSANVYAIPSPSIKNPFTVSRYEIEVFQSPDVRLGGFGPLFASALVLSIICMFILTLSRKKIWRFIVLPPLLIFLTVALNPQGWWARYAPQLWLIPITIVAGLLISSRLFNKLLAFALMSILLIDIMIVSIGYFPTNISESNRSVELMRQLASSQRLVLVYYKPFFAVQWRLDRMGVRYISVNFPDLLPCPLPLDLLTYYSPTSCPP